jgi:hypothetical protein
MRHKILLRSCTTISTGLILLAAVASAQAADPTKQEKTTSPWSVEASAGLEYDDNLSVPELDVSSGQSDMAAVFDLSVGYKVPGLSDYEVEAGYDFYQSLYQDYSEFNLQNHSLHVSGSRGFNDLDVGMAYRFTYSRLDDEDFLQIHHLQPNLGYSVQPNWYLTLAYSFQDKDFADFSRRDGDQHALLLDNYVVFNGNKSYARFGYRYEDEDTDGAEFDYTGHYLNLGLSTPWKLSSQHGKLELGYQYYTRDYSNITPSIGKKRDDDRHTFNIKGILDLPSNFFASLSYEHIDASSNLPSADFDENIVTLSAGRRW